MDTASLQYMDFLKNRLKILEAIHKNTSEQSNALKEKDYTLLKKLLNDRQRLIEKLAQIMPCSKACDGFAENEEMGELEQSIGILCRKIVSISSENVKKAEKYKNDIAGVIKHLNLGRHAIRNGYFKRMPQQFGYFIDKKIGR